MAAAPPGRELCPHCHKPFKRLRSHLPHCKAAPSPAPGSAPGPSLGLGPAASSAPGLSPGPAAGPSAPGSGSGSDGAGPAAGSGAGSGPRAGAAGKSSKRPPSPGVGQGLPDGASREAAAGGRAETAAAARKGKKAAAEQGGGSGPGLCRQPDGRSTEWKVEPAVQDVAKSLDLPPEEVKGIPEKLSNGVKIVIEKHRARVIREKSGSRSRGVSAGSHNADRSPVEGPHPGSAADPTDAAQPDPREGITVPETANTETRGLGAAEDAPASSKGEKGSSLKAIKIPVLKDPPEADCSNSPGDLVQQKGIDKTVTEEEQMYLEVGVECKAPLSALHTKNLHLSVIEGFRGHNEGTSKNYLTSIQKLRESKEQMALASEPILNARRDTELALHQFLLHTSKSQPICLSQASGRSTPAGAMGLEWFPDLYPNYDGLSIFQGKPFQEDVGITTKIPKGNFSEGRQGPLAERRLMDVRLGELPAWLATCDLSPQGLLGGVRKAWSGYYDKYINVKRGGPAGISMLLAGYCLLSYVWNYQHIKCHRWRKYH
ncbi:mitochondrial nucleoid-associated protein 1 isoform X2 [Aptenodytes patagonicus]|uniref:mitochondrial nucleoid-associated protein 1 isoform X2 n=1 Tax=Aptenodytes patagonicus TaxID=9234 RepID=UPI003F9EF530